MPPERPSSDDPPSAATSAAPSAGAAGSGALRHWHARLELGIARRGEASVAVHRRHSGPLRLQKPLHPEGPGVAHLVVVHPPAGIAGGDRLEIDVDVRDDAHALVTTPGAAKWYRSGGARARQAITLSVARGAHLEWLPQEAIVFDGADVATTTTIDCARGATCIGWDIVVLGRVAAGERFARGAWRQDLTLACDGRTVWRERARLVGSDALLASPNGWDGLAVGGTLWAWGAALPEAAFEHCRQVTMGRTTARTTAHAAARSRAGITRLRDGLVVARALSDSAEELRALFEALWTIIRPVQTARPATPPRIWAT